MRKITLFGIMIISLLLDGLLDPFPLNQWSVDKEDDEMTQIPSKEELQEARDQLLELRSLMGLWYTKIPASDRVIRLLDRAIELIPGEGVPSKVPYEKFS